MEKAVVRLFHILTLLSQTALSVEIRFLEFTAVVAGYTLAKVIRPLIIAILVGIGLLMEEVFASIDPTRKFQTVPSAKIRSIIAEAGLKSLIILILLLEIVKSAGILQMKTVVGLCQVFSAVIL